MSFWGELKRRNVFKVGAAYLIAAWLIVQVVSIAFPAFHMPEWTVTFVMSLLIIGFFVAIILAWAYEVTPDGVKLTKRVLLADSITQVTGQKLNYILAGLLIVAVGYIIALQFFISKPPAQTEVVSDVTTQTTPTVEEEEAAKTVAVLPFDDLSPEKDQEYFVDGLSEEIINYLVQIPDLNVTGKTSSFSFKGSNKTVQEIADVLGVENVLEGSVRKAGNDLRITAQLLRAEDGFHLFSKTYNRKLENIFEIQENIAKSVADELKTTLGIDRSLKQLGGTDNEKAYEFFLVALGQAVKSNYSGAFESIDTALSLDPGFALAWSLKARAYTVGSFIGQAQGEVSVPLDAAKRAIDIEPNLGPAYINLGNIQSLSGKYVEAELSFQKGVELLKESLSGDDDFIISHYQTVGRFKKAHEYIEQIRRNDPLHIGYAGYSIVDLGIKGEIKRAEDEYEWCKTAFGDDWWFELSITNARIGSGDALSRDEVIYSDLIFDTAKEHLESPEKGLAELHRLFVNNNLGTPALNNISLWAGYFGDPNFALDALEKKMDYNDVIGKSIAVPLLWFPVMHEVRQTPRFKNLMRDRGLVEYWNQFGWPDICRPTDDGDFVCD